MSKKVIVFHGTCEPEEYFSGEYPSLSNSHWLPWLQKQLLIAGIEAHTPEVAGAYEPVYESWSEELERFSVDGETVLVGHSCGAGFLVRWLTENPVPVDKLVLVAPWLDPARRKTDRFFDFIIDPGIQDRAGEVHIFVSQDDSAEILDSVEKISQQLPQARVHQFADKGHFTYEEMRTGRFPELLEVVLGRS